MSHTPLIERVSIRNYKSIGACDVELGWLNLIVGRNGAGKSNFLDALRFVWDSLQYSLDHAVRSRGGIDEVRRRSTGHPHNFSIGLTLSLSELRTAEYEFEIAAKKGGFAVKSESLRLIAASGEKIASYDVSSGQVTASVPNPPPASEDRLYLVNASGLPQFREVYDALSSMGFYAFNPEQIKEVQAPDSAELLRRDGANLASVIARLGDEAPEVKSRIREYLKQIVDDIEDFERVALGPRETILFKQRVKGSASPWRFYAAGMSDGTLRTLAVLVAVLQLAQRAKPIRLAGVEEPETALHPAAAGALMDAMRQATQNTQVVLTTHSPDLLDRLDPETDTLLVVQSNEGTTTVAPADRASREAIKGHLYTAGELLRSGQLQPDQDYRPKQRTLPYVEEPA